MSLDKVKELLKIFRLTDEQGNLSLTNIALIAVLIKLLLQPEINVTDTLTFVGTLVSYQAKRFISGTQPSANEDSEQLRAAVEALQTKVSALQVGNVLKGK